MIKGKLISLLLFLAFITIQRSAAQQTDSLDFIQKIKEYNLCSVFFPDSILGDDGKYYSRPEILGFIDTSFERFQIHFTSISKSRTNPGVYNISGKTKVRNNICSFSGTITLFEAKLMPPEVPDVRGFSDFKEGYIKARIRIDENKKHPGSGIIKGILTTDFVIDKHGKISYDALDLVADSYFNNQFEGSWTSYKTGKSKKCNWGDFRIPDSKGLDGGDGEFVPSEKCLNHGWRTYYLSWGGDLGNPKEQQEAIRIENFHWWK